MTNLIHRFTNWLERKFFGTTPKVVKQIRHQGFVSMEDLVQLGELDKRITNGWQQLARLADRKVDVYTFEYVLEKLCGITLSDIKE